MKFTQLDAFHIPDCKQDNTLPPVRPDNVLNLKPNCPPLSEVKHKQPILPLHCSFENSHTNDMDLPSSPRSTLDKEPLKIFPSILPP